jgi:hypothetical protein
METEMKFTRIYAKHGWKRLYRQQRYFKITKKLEIINILGYRNETLLSCLHNVDRLSSQTPSSCECGNELFEYHEMRKIS